MVGTVWQWTNWLQDEHTKTAMLKGGSAYWRREANASSAPRTHSGGCISTDQYYCDEARSPYWFANCAGETWVNWPQGGKLTEVMPLACHGELILLDQGYERASTIGFRCAVSVGATPPQPPPMPPPPPSPPGPPPSGPLVFAPTVGYSWADGSPDASGSRISSGVYADEGRFQLKVAAAEQQEQLGRRSSGGSSKLHVLRLYVGAFCRGATLTAVAGAHTASKKLPRFKPLPAPCEHGTGTLNVMFEVTFSGKLTLTWQQDASSSGHTAQEESSPKSGGGDGSDEESDGNLTWQSAALDVRTNSSACAASAVCISDPQVLPKGSNTDLTKVGGVDWVHWGGLGHGRELITAKGGEGGGAGPRAPWYAEEKLKGPGLLRASLVK